MLEVRSKRRPSNKYNDKLRHKDGALVVFARQSNRRDRYMARRQNAVLLREEEARLRLDRVINTLCREAGIHC